MGNRLKLGNAACSGGGLLIGTKSAFASPVDCLGFTI